MPITQDRMIALIDAALDFKHAASAICESIIAAGRAAERGEMTYQEAFNLVATAARLDVLCQAESAITIAIEARHFKLKREYNIKNRDRVDRWRTKQGQKQSSAPKSLIPHEAHLTPPSQHVALTQAELPPPADADEWDVGPALPVMDEAPGGPEPGPVTSTDIANTKAPQGWFDEEQLRRILEAEQAIAVKESQEKPAETRDTALDVALARAGGGDGSEAGEKPGE
jgi:hypothetical protein